MAAARASNEQPPDRTRRTRRRRALLAAPAGPAVLAALLAASMVVSGCGRDASGPPRGEGDGPSATSPELSLREYEDATGAIGTFLAAGRTREAELVARKLHASAARGSFARGAAGQAARALVARADLDDALTPRERHALVVEAAALAREASEATAGGPPPSVETLRFAALLADRLGDRIAARGLYDAALAAAPGDAATLLPAALSALARDPNDPRVDALVERHERLAPDAPWSAGLRAELALARGDAPAALAAAEEGLRRGRELVEMRLILAKALRANGRAEDAARLLGALEASERAKAPVALELARALTAADAHAAAAEALARAVGAQPADPILRAEAAIAFARAGERDRASAELEALASIPGAEREHARAAAAIATIADDVATDEAAPR